MKTMIMPLYANVILRPYENNPYVEMTSKEGLILTYNDLEYSTEDLVEAPLFERNLLLNIRKDLRYLIKLNN